MTSPLTHLPASQWIPLAHAHQQRVKELTAEHLTRRRKGKRHPVWDFMFNYYPISPGKLSHWHPGAGYRLEIPPEATASALTAGGCTHRSRGGEGSAGQQEKDAYAPPSRTSRLLPRYKDHYTQQDGTWGLDLHRHWQDRGRTITYIHRLLRLTYSRPAQLNCFGLHEWAMVYRSTPRHPEPLRLGAHRTNAVVEAGHLRCTHCDAFRFFTPDAAPRNARVLGTQVPTRENQHLLEQPGCLHATMDLYKWAAKLGPLIPGELWLRTFELACTARQLDMQASPYDLHMWGYEPVKIEQASGRAEYVRRQQAISQQGQQLRKEILTYVQVAYPHLGEVTG